MAAIATFALKPGVWFRRVRLVIVSPDSQRTACLLSGRNSTYRPVQISGTGSVLLGHVKSTAALCVPFGNFVDIDPLAFAPLPPGEPDYAVDALLCLARRIRD